MTLAELGSHSKNPDTGILSNYYSGLFFSEIVRLWRSKPLFMYLIDIEIEEIRSISHVLWNLERPERTTPSGWHVVIGDNGSGKSTFLRSVALALVGPSEAQALRQDWGTWIRGDKTQGNLSLIYEIDERYDKFSGKGKTEKYISSVGLTIYRDKDSVRIRPFNRKQPTRNIWGGKRGWFSASYGPFRRFSGGDKEYEKLFYSNPRLAAHLSVFGENVALSECIQWLQDLQFKKLENRPEGELIDYVKAFVNQADFLPFNARLIDVSSKGVVFVDGNGFQLSVDSLSDGYRSVLSMTFEIIRQMTRVYEIRDMFSDDRSKILVPGVVLIDEVDAHLHPSWQRKIGGWLCRHFPNLQFIVTTHSPLVCQNAKTIFRLPQPGSSEEGQMVEDIDFERLRLGNVLEAYSTELFGSDVTRSDESKRMLERLAFLNSEEIRRTLDKKELSEQSRLRAALPTEANTLGTD